MYSKNGMIVIIVIVFAAMATQGYGDELQYFNSSYTSKSFNMTHATTTIVYHGVARYDLLSIWSSVKIKVNCSADCRFYQIYPTRHYLSSNDDKLLDRKYLIWLLTLNWHITHISPYDATYVHVRISGPMSKFTLLLEHQVFNWLLFLTFTAGLLFYFTATTLSRSRLVFYGISIAIGISIGSVLAFAISFHYCSKLLPQKSVTNIIAIGGILIMTYFVDYRPFNYASFLIANKEAIAIYVVISGGLTFCLCHTYEPGPEDPKRKVIQWIIQAIAILLMYYGLQLQEISFLVIIACWIWSWQYHATKATAVVKATFKKFRKRYALRATVNTPHRFLTQEEFVTEGKVETEKALQQLRDYCTSPECNTWEIVKKLKDPKRFAELLYGNGDLDDRELYRWMNDSMFDVE